VRFFTFATSFCLMILAYHYAGYAALMKLLAKMRPRPVKRGEIVPSITLIIAAYNETAVIEQKIKNSLALDYPADKLEIIVITDGSDDTSPDIVAQYADQGVKLMHEPVRRGKSAAMNRAAAQAAGDILVFSDANAFYLPDVVRQLARNFHDEAVGCVSGNKTIRSSAGNIGQSAGLYWRYESAIKTWESQVGSTVAVVGEMLAVRRDCFEPIPSHIINDDAYIATRLMSQRWRVLYEPEAVCWETAVVSTKDEVIRRRRINAGRYQLMFSPQVWPWPDPFTLMQLISHKFLRLLLPFFMIGALVANVILVVKRSANWLMKLAFLGQMLVYTLAAIGALSQNSQKRYRLPMIAHYIVTGNLTSLQGLVHYLSGKQTVLWAKAAREQTD
jgi:biofilm PGA synthesis N-glycosyltransferase PgaC